jgi:hypothetical protein
MLSAVLKAVNVLKNSEDAAVLTALEVVQDVKKNHPHKDQVQRLIPIIICLFLLLPQLVSCLCS